MTSFAWHYLEQNVINNTIRSWHSQRRPLFAKGQMSLYKCSVIMMCLLLLNLFWDLYGLLDLS